MPEHEKRTFDITVEYVESWTGPTPNVGTTSGTITTLSLDLLMIRLVTKGFPIPLDAIPGEFSIDIYEFVEGKYIPPNRILSIDWEQV